MSSSPSPATILPGHNSLDLIQLRHPSGSKVEIYLHGATLTRWQSRDGIDHLFVSDQSLFNEDEKKPIRGGIPLVFPQFGPGLLPQHGFARNSRWEVDHVEPEKDGHVSIILVLNDTPDTRAVWDHAFRLEYTVKLSSDTIETGLSVVNRNGNADQSFSFTSLLHTYFAVSDIAQVSVNGLKGLKFLDKLVTPLSEQEETRESLTVSQETDRVYTNLSNDHQITLLTGNGHDVVIKNSGFNDAVVWNPWIEKSKAMKDFGDDEYHNMICIELGTVAKPVSLAPGESWRASQILMAVSSKI